MLHSISSHQLDLLHSMEGYLNTTVVPILKNVKTMWQPSDFLPDSSSPDFLDQVCHHPKHPLDEPPLCISTALLYACARCGQLSLGSLPLLLSSECSRRLVFSIYVICRAGSMEQNLLYVCTYDSIRRAR